MLTVCTPGNLVRNAAEGVLLLLGGELEAVVDAIELLLMRGGSGAETLLLKLQQEKNGVGLHFSEAHATTEISR